MSVVTAVLLGLAMGAVFGLALEKSRVFDPGTIVSQMQLRTFLMLKIFLTAVATGLVVLAILNGLFGVKMYPKALSWPADLIGGLVLGMGIAIAGACPGTVFAQIGAGYRDAWFTVLGGLLGAGVFGYLEPTLRPVLAASAKPTIATLTHLPFWPLALLLAAVLVAALYALERARPWTADIGRDADGLQPDATPVTRTPLVA